MRLKKDKITIDEIRRRVPSLDSTKGGESVLPRPTKASIESVREGVQVLAEGQSKPKKKGLPPSDAPPVNDTNPEPETDDDEEEGQEAGGDEAPPKAKKKGKKKKTRE